MEQNSKYLQLDKEFERFNLDMLGVSETHWQKSGTFVSDTSSTVFLYSGNETGKASIGVGIMLSKSAHNCMLSWRPISGRLMVARFNSRVRKISIIQCYAPTESNYTDAEKDVYYSLLNSVYKTVPRGDIVIVMVDFNAQTGRDDTGIAHVMGKHGVEIKTYNGNGERFLNFLEEEEGNQSTGNQFTGNQPTWNQPTGQKQQQYYEDPCKSPKPGDCGW